MVLALAPHTRTYSVAPGAATVFVSWALVSTPRDLLNALEAYECKKGLDPASTFYWVCNFCIRQLDGKEEDVPRLGERVAACPRFVMLLEPVNTSNHR